MGIVMSVARFDDHETGAHWWQWGIWDTAGRLIESSDDCQSFAGYPTRAAAVHDGAVALLRRTREEL